MNVDLNVVVAITSVVVPVATMIGTLNAATRARIKAESRMQSKIDEHARDIAEQKQRLGECKTHEETARGEVYSRIDRVSETVNKVAQDVSFIRGKLSGAEVTLRTKDEG